jgi:hypothetical protein
VSFFKNVTIEGLIIRNPPVVLAAVADSGLPVQY